MKAMDLMRRLSDVITLIRYKDWTLILAEKHNVPYLQVSFPARDAATGVNSFQYGRKWMLSSEMSPSEIVQTALMAVLAAEEHEARESFTYRGVAVFQPHLDLDEIAPRQTVDQQLSEIIAAIQPIDQRLSKIEALDPWRDLL